MPLSKGKSKQAFSKNVATEMNAGKPQKQALAIAYAQKRKAQQKSHGGNVKQYEEEEDMIPMSKKQRAMAAFHGKKMAEGGDLTPIKDDRLQSDAHECDMCGGSHPNEEHEHDRHDRMGEPMMAEGGQISDNYQSSDSKINQTKRGNVDPQDTYAMDHEGNSIKQNKSAMMEDDRKLNQHGADEMGPEDGSKEMSESYMGNPGDSHDEYQSEDAQDANDLISRIMKQRMYSRGGMIANKDSGESASIPDQMAKDKPNEMDDLALRDDLEFSYNDANSGDEDSDMQEDKDRSDIIKRVMKSRNMKAGKLPKSIKPGL